ncbi:MAG: DUF2332 domain-containing protein [Actinomycetota bacterium]|nr:DUF2332 domain-containing protein [Actinomycetota bacterium]
MPTLDELADRFRDFGAISTRTRAPLYTRLAAGIAEDRDLLGLLQHAPPTQQQPVLLLAAVHFLLLRGDDTSLAAHYPNLSPPGAAEGDPVALFRSFALAREELLLQVLTTRNTQTNEVGRCAQFLPAFGMLAREVGALAHIDVGTSAGLNLLLPRFEYEYTPGSSVRPVHPSPVLLRCGVRGDARVPVPATMPGVARSVGLDQSPIDVLDDDEVRWLEACVWPDQADRFARLVGAIGMAREHPPEVHRGDAVDDLAALVDRVRPDGHPVVTNSWVLNYLPDDVRLRYVAELDRLGSEHDLSWVIAESPAATPGLPVPTSDPPEEITVISLVRWRGGTRSVQRLATTHPHGYWVQWEA